jgi:hypothetical protein
MAALAFGPKIAAQILEPLHQNVPGTQALASK